MGHLRVRRPSPAFAVSLVALFVALGGSGYAATRLGHPAASVAKKKPKKKACISSAAALCPTLRGAVDAEVARQIRVLNTHNGATGPQGLQGLQGSPGAPGATGPPGPGASSFAMTLPNGAAETTLTTLSNGIRVSGGCSGFAIQLYVDTTSGNPNSLQMSGTATGGMTGGTLMIEDLNDTSSGAEMNGNIVTDFDVIARDSTGGGKFARIDVHGTYGSPCNFWGMITPSS